MIIMVHVCLEKETRRSRGACGSQDKNM